jgi:hypothetical protein
MAERELREEVAEEAMAEELEEEDGQKKQRKNTSQKDLEHMYRRKILLDQRRMGRRSF